MDVVQCIFIVIGSYVLEVLCFYRIVVENECGFIVGFYVYFDCQGDWVSYYYSQEFKEYVLQLIEFVFFL